MLEPGICHLVFLRFYRGRSVMKTHAVQGSSGDGCICFFALQRNRWVAADVQSVDSTEDDGECHEPTPVPKRRHERGSTPTTGCVAVATRIRCVKNAGEGMNYVEKKGVA